MLDDKVCVAILAGGLSSRMGGGIKTLKTFNNKGYIFRTCRTLRWTSRLFKMVKFKK